MQGSKLMRAIGVVLILAGLGGIGSYFVPRSHSIPSVPLDRLGLAEDHSDQSELIASSLPPFLMVGADGQDNESKNVRLWDAMLAVRGSHLPNIPQQIGDCVSWGAANAVNYLQAYQLIRGPPGFQFKEAYPPYIYGVSRVLVGRKHGSNFRGDGSVGAYAAEGLRDYGVLRADVKECPPYSGSIARMWGDKGPPEWAVNEAKQFVVKTIAQVKSAEEARDAICNGYPVTIASSWWGTTKIDTVDGRKVATRNTSWGHQQCLIGYDGSGPNKYFYCLNSWGPNAHPKPIAGEPPGGYWIRWNDVDRICKVDKDSWAMSSFDGFRAETINWDDLLKRREIRDANPITSIGIQTTRPPENEGPEMEGLILFASVMLVIIGAVVFTLGGFGRRRKAALILLMWSLMLSGNVVDAQQLDFAAATVRRAPPSTAAIGAEPDWSTALHRRDVTTQQGDTLPVSWDQAILRASPPATVAKQPGKKSPLTTSKVVTTKPEQCLFFTAPWCSWCDVQKSYMSPRVQRLGLTMSEAPDADFRMVNVENHRDLQTEYGVNSLPCLVYLRSGQEVDRVTGYDRHRLKAPDLTQLR